MAGMVLLAVGVILLLKNIGYFFPNWLFSWPMALIVLGLFVGVKHNFRNPGGVILILLGCLFLAKKFFYFTILWEYVWPIIIILLGVWMIFGKSNRHRVYSQETIDFMPETLEPNPNPNLNPNSNFNQYNPAPENPHLNSGATEDEYLDTTSVFGGTKKLILSKNFKGGEVVTVMGGAELNFSQADIQGRAILDVTQIMGGTKIIVPAHWDVKSEMAAILGGIDDKRMVTPGGIDPNKVLIIKGTSILGGIDIRSY